MKRTVNPKRKNTVFVLAVRIWIIHVIDLLLYIFVLYLCVPIFGDATALVCASVAAPLGYLILGYWEGWSFGLDDMNKVLYGRSKKDPYKALKGCALSQIPGLVLALLHVFGVGSSVFSTALTYFYMAFSYEISLTADSAPFVALLPALLPFLCVVPGYYMGYRQKRISDKLVYTARDRDLR